MSEPTATVIATFSRRMRLRLEDGQEVDARIKGKKLRPVCGDRVIASEIPNEDDWLISAVDPRQNELSRPNARGREEVLAANVDLVIVVAAATPKPDWFIVDRYLCAAELMHAAGAVVFNKVDLVAPPQDALQVYENVGYPTLSTSVKPSPNIGSLAELVADQTAIIVGQSGVGKSSIINALTDKSRQRISSVSRKSGEGQHTTVNSVMISLPAGGNIIDSPGVRDYAPMLRSASDAIVGFREIAAAGDDCQFANCRHLQEPVCAVKAGVDGSTIDARRYESYRRIVILTEQRQRGRY